MYIQFKLMHFRCNKQTLNRTIFLKSGLLSNNKERIKKNFMCTSKIKKRREN